MIGVIVNPNSQVHRRDPGHVRELVRVLGDRGTAVTTRSIDEVRGAVEQLRAERIDVLGISGGDGTIAHTLTAVLGVYGAAPPPRIAFLSGGTVNTIPRGLGITLGGPAMLRRVLAGEVRIDRRHILQIGDMNGFIFGAGAIASFCEAYYETGAPSAAMSARLLARAVGSTLIHGPFIRRLMTRLAARITVDGERWPVDDFALVMAGTVPQIGLGSRPFYRCDERPGHHALIGVHCGAAALVAELPRVFRGVGMSPRKVIDVVAREAVIESDAPFSYVVDGDLLRCEGTLRVRTGPRLELLVPAA
ncbi:MAG TPA: diacylglycerol kinase family protein [Kofleriaceae bacterium]